MLGEPTPPPWPIVKFLLCCWHLHYIILSYDSPWKWLFIITSPILEVREGRLLGKGVIYTAGRYSKEVRCAWGLSWFVNWLLFCPVIFKERVITASFCRVFQNLTGGGGKEGVLKDTATPQPILTDHSFRGDLTPVGIIAARIHRDYRACRKLQGQAVEKMSRATANHIILFFHIVDVTRIRERDLGTWFHQAIPSVAWELGAPYLELKKYWARQLCPTSNPVLLTQE